MMEKVNTLEDLEAVGTERRRVMREVAEESFDPAARRLEATYRKRRSWWHARKKEWLVKVAAMNAKRRSEYAETKGT